MSWFLFSIGRVDPELYGLAAGTGKSRTICTSDQNEEFHPWMEDYVNVLCLNSWQVPCIFSSPFLTSFPHQPAFQTGLLFFYVFCLVEDSESMK